MESTTYENFEQRFRHVQHCDTAIAPTGEPFVVLHAGTWAVDETDAEIAMRSALDEYAAGRAGVLYWRVPPQVTYSLRHGWTFYARLLISDKEPTL